MRGMPNSKLTCGKQHGIPQASAVGTVSLLSIHTNWGGGAVCGGAVDISLLPFLC